MTRTTVTLNEKAFAAHGEGCRCRRCQEMSGYFNVRLAQIDYQFMELSVRALRMISAMEAIRPPAPAWRVAVTAVALVTYAAVAAPFIRSFDFGSWGMALALMLLVPFAATLLAGRPPAGTDVIGLCAAIAQPASFFVHDVVLFSTDSSHATLDLTTIGFCIPISIVIAALPVLVADAILEKLQRPRNAHGFPVVELRTHDLER